MRAYGECKSTDLSGICFLPKHNIPEGHVNNISMNGNISYQLPEELVAYLPVHQHQLLRFLNNLGKRIIQDLQN